LKHTDILYEKNADLILEYEVHIITTTL